MRVKKMIVAMLIGAVVLSVATVSSSAVERKVDLIGDSSREKMLEISADYETVARFSNRSERQLKINEILEKDPNALIFYSQQEADEFFNSATFEFTENIEMNAKSVVGVQGIAPMSTPSIQTHHYTAKVFFNLTGASHTFHFSHAKVASSAGVRWGGRVGTPFLTVSGIHIGITPSLAGSHIEVLCNITNLDVRYTVQLRHYIIHPNVVVASEATHYRLRGHAQNGFVWVQKG
jgi:outer membrane murein-binding lipoprotein Lpp